MFRFLEQEKIFRFCDFRMTLGTKAVVDAHFVDGLLPVPLILHFIQDVQ